MSDALAPSDVARELEAHRARKAKLLHEHYDVEQGEQHIAELEAQLGREKGVLDGLRARLLDQLRQEVAVCGGGVVGSTDQSEEAVRAQEEYNRRRRQQHKKMNRQQSQKKQRRPSLKNKAA